MTPIIQEELGVGGFGFPRGSVVAFARRLDHVADGLGA